jgi:hypothetical protein
MIQSNLVVFVYLICVDKVLAIGTAFLGKMEEFIEVRRILRDDSASGAPPAARRNPRAKARSSSFMSGG